MSYQGGPYWQYPPSAPPPPPPQPPRRNSRWPAFATERGILLYVLAPLLAVLLVVLLAVGVSAARQRLVAQTPQPTLAPYPTVTAYPTGTATTPPTATATSAPTAPAILGSTQDAFTAAFGNPEMRGPVPWYSDTATDGTPLLLCVCDVETGTDGQGHVGILSVGPTDTSASWPESQGIAESKAFFPADAVYINDIQDPDVGTIHVYRSATLAQTFPAGDFENTGPSGGLVPPGTFIIACEIPGPPGCELRLGT